MREGTLTRGLVALAVVVLGFAAIRYVDRNEATVVNASDRRVTGFELQHDGAPRLIHGVLDPGASITVALARPTHEGSAVEVVFPDPSGRTVRGGASYYMKDTGMRPLFEITSPTTVRVEERSLYGTSWLIGLAMLAVWGVLGRLHLRARVRG